VSSQESTGLKKYHDFSVLFVGKLFDVRHQMNILRWICLQLMNFSAWCILFLFIL